MFCPNCGKGEQKANNYCRGCGEFLPDLNKKTNLAFGGSTPEEQIRTNLFLNLLSALVSLILAVLLYATFGWKGGASPIIYIVAAFLLAMSGWQFSTFLIGLKLRKNFRQRKGEAGILVSSEANERFSDADTRELLAHADFSDVVPTSVTENTTEHLAEKIKRESS